MCVFNICYAEFRSSFVCFDSIRFEVLFSLMLGNWDVLSCDPTTYSLPVASPFYLSIFCLFVDGSIFSFLFASWYCGLYSRAIYSIWHIDGSDEARSIQYFPLTLYIFVDLFALSFCSVVRDKIYNNNAWCCKVHTGTRRHEVNFHRVVVLFNRKTIPKRQISRTEKKRSENTSSLPRMN